MPFTPADSYIFAPLFSEPLLAAIFSDEQSLRGMLAVERALARAEGRLGVIPVDAAEVIAKMATSATLPIDAARLQSGLAKDGFPVIELVRQLRQAVGGASADYVHFGATTQDIMDTALILQIRSGLEVLEGQVQRLVANLAGLAERHRHTLMAGRTHSQQATPITFGLKVAGWLAPLLRDRARLIELKPRLLVVQLGGAAGTLAALGGRGLAVQAGLADELGLAAPVMPWHTQRDGFAELAGWLSLVSGSLAKMAQDIILLAQSEVGEVRESDDPERGGSSAMPQKTNPITSELIVAAARANAAHLAAMHQALINEHERGTHAWQLEWLVLPQMFALTGSALKHAVWLSENLVVDAERMQQNVHASNGLMLAEALTVALAPILGRNAARQLIDEAVRVAVVEKRHLVDVVQAKTTAGLDWQAIRAENNYLGAAQALIDRVLKDI